MPKNSFLKALFSGPKFSLAPIEQNNRGTLRIGEVVPVFSTILNPREGVELDMSHLVRFLPAKAPVMEGYKVTFDAFAVPYSTLGYAERKERDIDDFFNIKENAGEIPNPFCFTFSNLKGIIGENIAVRGTDGVGLNYAFKLGSLADYINFPSLKNVREHVRQWLVKYGLVSNSGRALVVGNVRLDVADFLASAYLNDGDLIDYDASVVQFPLEVGGDDTVSLYVFAPFSIDLSQPAISDELLTARPDLYYDIAYDTGMTTATCSVRSLLGFILDNYPAVASYFNLSLDTAHIETSMAANYANLSKLDSLDYLQVLYDNYKIDAQSIYNQYFEYVMSCLLYNPTLVDFDENTLWEGAGDDGEHFLPNLSKDEPIDLSYFAAYWKIISDWYINTNIDGDPDDFFLEHCHLLTDSDLASRPTRYVDVLPFKRRWANDIFTSSVPMASVQNIRIPADGTIPDLREANAYQKLVDIFRNTGSRLRDVVYGVFGITPSAVRSEMSEPIGSLSTWLGMQSILQTSETTPESPQAAYAGIGTDSSNGYKRILKYVNNAEPTPVIVMVLMSVTQRASYMQGFDRKFFRKSIYDFAVPELAMIGEQEVTNKEVYFDKFSTNGVFGFNRRYYDWFYSGSEVHGDLRDSLDYWHGARIFDEQPALNSEFIGIESEKDHLHRVFANTSDSAQSIVYNISFNGYKTVALPRYIQYEL